MVVYVLRNEASLSFAKIGVKGRHSRSLAERTDLRRLRTHTLERFIKDSPTIASLREQPLARALQAHTCVRIAIRLSPCVHRSLQG
jgi:hypothetical protein